jgi:hypothetical protein
MTERASSPRAPRSGNRRLLLGLGAVIAVVLIAGATLVGTGIIHLGSKVVSLAVTPDAVLLPAVGATRALAASTVDSAGKASPATATWTSSKPEVVAVVAGGVVTAKALGSAQVTATSGSLTAAPVLVVVTAPAAGVTLVEDAQVVGGPVETDPDEEPAADNTYEVTLKGLSPKVGDRLLGTGGKAVAGEVVAVVPAADGATTATLKLVPLPELLPNLEIDERIALTNAPVEVVPDVARLYDVTRGGTKFTFTPKANFAELAQESPASSRSRAGPGIAAAGWGLGWPPGATVPEAVGVPVGTHALPFSECELKSDNVSNEGPRLLPFSLSDGPSFEIDVDPFLELTWNDDDKRFVIGASPKVKLTIGLKVDVAFKATYECKATLFTFRIPIAGALSAFVSGLVPVGAGFELGGEVTLASAQLSVTTEVTGTLGIGFACAGDQGCAVVHELDGSVTKPPEVTAAHLPTDADLRFKPSLEAFGFVEAAVGNPFFKSLRLEAAEAKVGPKLELDWAPHAIQIADPAYASEFKATFDLAVTVGADLEGIADRLGLGDILQTGFEKSVDLEGSPKGTLDVSKTKLTVGQPTTATVNLSENVSFLALYNVAKVVLVASPAGGTETTLAAVTATAGQVDFDLSFTPTEALKPADLHAFVVTKFPPGDIVDFELAGTKSPSRIAFVGLESPPSLQIWSMNPDGTDVRRLTSGPQQASAPTWSPDGSRIAFSRTEGIGAPSVWVMNADGTDAHQIFANALYPAWSPDGTRIAIVRYEERRIAFINPDGSGLRELPNTAYSLAWSPDGKRIAFGNHSKTTFGISVINADGSGLVDLTDSVGGRYGDTAPSWSPDGKQIAFSSARDHPEGISEMYIMNANGTGIVRLNQRGGLAVWSSDGKQLLFTSYEGVEGALPHLAFVNVDGSGFHLLSTDYGTFAAWFQPKP